MGWNQGSMGRLREDTNNKGIGRGKDTPKGDWEAVEYLSLSIKRNLGWRYLFGIW